MKRIALLLVVMVAGCSPDYPSRPTSFGPLPDDSLYQLEGTWETDRGDSLSFSAFRGYPVVLTLMYSHCTAACPLLVNDMKRIDLQTPSGEPTQFVLVTMDPERDTPEQLARFKEGYMLGERWTLLRGTPENIRTLAALLGIRYRPEEGGEYAHSNIVSILDAEGRLVHQDEGLGTDPVEARNTLTAMYLQ